MENVNKKQLAENVKTKFSELRKAVLEAQDNGLQVELKMRNLEDLDFNPPTVFEKTLY